MLEINYLSFHLKKLENEDQIYIKLRRKDINKIKPEINEIKYK